MKRKIELKQRKENLRKELKLFLIICEGEKTERFYFKEFRERNNGIRIEVPNCSYTDPVNLVRFANKIKSAYDIDLKRGDSIWCVFDADLNNNDMIKKAGSEAGRDKIEIALSNPCFEVWYLLHFEFSTAFMSTGQVVQKLKNSYIPLYQKNKSVFDQLKPYLSRAIENARKLNSYHENNQTPFLSSGSNPSTQVFKLVQQWL